MTESSFFEAIEAMLKPLGYRVDVGEFFREPTLDVLHYLTRPVRVHWLPVVGKGLGVVALVRQPSDLQSDARSTVALIDRVARASHGRYPPWPRGAPGFLLGLMLVIVTPEPLALDDDARLQRALADAPRRRVLPTGLIRVNLIQEVFSFAIGGAPRALFPEPERLADGLSRSLGRFLNPLEG